MDITLKRSIDIMKKITIGCQVVIGVKTFTVVDIVPCVWQRNEYNNEYDIGEACYHCIGKIQLEGNDHPNCFFINNVIEFDNVIENELLTIEDMRIE